MPFNTRKDLTGQTINQVYVVAFAGLTKRSKSLWLVRDQAGNERVRRIDKVGNNFRPGRRATVLHGMSRSSEYNIWRGLQQRCCNPKNPGFKYYGARGISVCQRWHDSFAAFLADMGPRPAGRSIDRINNDGNYEPENCRWATSAEQNANKRQAAK